MNIPKGRTHFLPEAWLGVSLDLDFAILCYLMDFSHSESIPDYEAIQGSEDTDDMRNNSPTCLPD